METTEIRTDDPTGNIIPSNGWLVLAYTEQYQAGNGWRRSGIAILHRGGYEPFTTHRLIQDEEGVWFAEAGTYHQKLDQDLLDCCNERVAR